MIHFPLAEIGQKKQNFLPLEFNLSSWEVVQPYYEKLVEREINSLDQLKDWLIDWSELEGFLSEDFAWRYIKLSCNTEDEDIKNRYQFYINEIKPNSAPYGDLLNKKFVECPFTNDLIDSEDIILKRSVINEIELFRKENIPLYVKTEELAQKYQDIISQMMIMYQDTDYTLSHAAKFLKDPDRNIRKEVYELVSQRRSKDAGELNQIMDELIKIRHQIAINAGFDNFRDYKYKSLGRFDYTVEDVKSFRDSVASIISPITGEILKEKGKSIGLELSDMKPYDADAEPEGIKALAPYQNSEELITKTIKSFSRINSHLGQYLDLMDKNGFFDLDSRKGKAPGGYNYPLDETGIPFIFMNSTGKHRDLVTMFHEGGHAIHSFLTKELKLNAYKHTPSEVAELASMSMELISMDMWDEFYPDKDDLKRAIKEQLEGVIEILPWIALVDEFQDYIYTHPDINIDQRIDIWVELYKKYHGIDVNWAGYEDIRKILWQKQLHIFEVPFYYIEYGIAQLGALAVWKNYKLNPEKGLENYLSALQLGYTKTVPEIYNQAGISFNFSDTYLSELLDFVKEELRKNSEA